MREEKRETIVLLSESSSLMLPTMDQQTRTIRRSGMSRSIVFKPEISRSSIYSMRNAALFPWDLAADDDDDYDDFTIAEEDCGAASRIETSINIAKTCLGTGVIALPFAASQVECWLHVTGIILIALWSLSCVQRLLYSLDLVHFLKHSLKVIVPNECSGGLGEVAFFAFGKIGLHMMNLIFFLLLFMIIVAYLDAALGFLQDTFLATDNPMWNVLLTAIIVGCLSSGSDIDSLSKASGFGIGMVAFVFLVIIFGYGDFQNVSEWPTTEFSVTNFAQWYGTIVFGFGLVPLTYNFRASMMEPSDMIVASSMGLCGTCLMYIVMSIGVVLVFPATSLQGDVLQLLPNDSFLPTLVRLAMVGLVLTTAPLLVLPCGELVQDGVVKEEISPFFIRISICILAALITLWLPEFVYVLSFVGSCWCVLSFIVPPLFHFALLRKVREVRHNPSNNRGEAYWISTPVFYRSYWIDLTLLLFGATATFSSSVYTFKGLIE
jgi:amino acid permease